MTKRVQLYSLYERLWHWLQAASILLLIVTGFEIHAPGTVHLLGFRTAVLVHGMLAAITIANAFLALFHHLATGSIVQFLPPSKDFFALAIAQARYYTSGIFRGAPHPFVRRPHAKLNVLQQMTYLVILNVLLPLQVVTGVVLWNAAHLGRLLALVGGLRVVASVHMLSAWFFCAFLVMHVYLTTTGHTPWSHLRAMIVGWDHDEEAPEHHAAGLETSKEMNDGHA